MDWKIVRFIFLMIVRRLFCVGFKSSWTYAKYNRNKTLNCSLGKFFILLIRSYHSTLFTDPDLSFENILMCKLISYNQRKWNTGQYKWIVPFYWSVQLNRIVNNFVFILIALSTFSNDFSFICLKIPCCGV